MKEYIIPVKENGNNCMFDFMNAKPLIRCKDCENNKYIGTLETLCPMQVYVGEYGFCSNGKPKEDTEA